MLDYIQLEALLTVDEAVTFERTTQELNLSSFAVAQRIKTLKAQPGVTLIDRKLQNRPLLTPPNKHKIGQIIGHPSDKWPIYVFESNI